MSKIDINALRFCSFSSDSFATHADGRVPVQCLEARIIDQQVEFGVRDRFGRSVGARVYITRTEVRSSDSADSFNYVLGADAAAVGSVYYVVRGHAQRNGKDYGNAKTVSYFADQVDAEAHLAKYLKDTAKRAAKTAGA